MHLWLPAATLLILQCLASTSLVSAWQSTGGAYTDASSFTSAGTVSFRGSKLRVYDIDGTKVAEPRVGFASTCGNLVYNYLYLKHQLSIPIRIDTDTLRGHGSRAGKATLTELQVVASKALTNSGARVTVLAELKSSGRGALVFLCSSFDRCRSLRDAVASSPQLLRSAVQFMPIGMVAGKTIRFLPARSPSAPRIGNCNRGRWIVFQRRIDGSLSFARRWNDYVNGFGNPKSNYWMGLNRLFEMTATAQNNGYAVSYRCSLRIETEDFRGKKYWSEYGAFEVLSPHEGYRLRIGKTKRGSMLNMMYHNGMRFSTYDRDNDVYRGSCSRRFGYGGWWYRKCHNVNLNGAYTTDKSVTNHPNYDTAWYARRHIPMKETLMKFRCF